jgi:hypothetical protein
MRPTLRYRGGSGSGAVTTCWFELGRKPSCTTLSGAAHDDETNSAQEAGSDGEQGRCCIGQASPSMKSCEI